LGSIGHFFAAIVAARSGADDVLPNAEFVFESDSGALGSLKVESRIYRFLR